MTKMSKRILSMDEHVKKYQLDDEERATLEAFERGEYIPAPEKDQIKFRKELRESVIYTWAKREREKNKNINIRMSEEDINKLKAKSLKVGIPYQTIAASILHQYANDKIEIKI